MKISHYLFTFFSIGIFIPFFVFAQTPPSTPLSTSTSTESFIAELQSQIKALQTRINELEIELGVKLETPAEPQAIVALPSFTTTLSLGSRGDDVRNLQQFLAKDKEIYPEGLITSYYGPLTEKAVQRWQAKEGIIASGTSETTGYGRIGPKTRSKLNEFVAKRKEEKKIIICHIPPGNPAEKHTIEISSSALQTHLTHGDYEGACVIALPPSTATSTPPQTGTTTPTTATTTPSGTIPATPAQPIGQTGTTTISATPATPTQTSGGTPPPPSPTPPPPPSTATTTPPAPPPSPTPSSGDTTAPTISNVQAANITTSGATITWTTNESADSTVRYSLSSPVPSAASSTNDTTSVISHSIAIANLIAGKTYYYVVNSKDPAGNTGVSSEQNFSTQSPPSPPPPPSIGSAGTLKWRFANAGSTSPVIGSDGTIYSLSYGKLYALNPDGTQKWVFVSSGLNTYYPPTIGSDGTIYMKDDTKKLYAINPNGTQKWVITVADSIFGALALASDGTIYFSAFHYVSTESSGRVYAFNANGSIKWIFEGAGNDTPVVGPDNTIYVGGAYNSKLYALNPDGTLKWQSAVLGQSGWDMGNPTVDFDGTIYVSTGSSPYKLYAINPNGTIKWEFNTIAETFVSIDGNGILYASDGSTLYALNPNGTQKWSFSIKTLNSTAYFEDAPAVGFDNTIYIIFQYNQQIFGLLALNSQGTKKWTYPAFIAAPTMNTVSAGAGPFGPAIGSDGTIYAQFIDGSGAALYAIYSDSIGLANSPWPKLYRNNRNTSNVSDPVALQKTSQPTLAFILQSLGTVLDDIQKQIQKLGR